MKKNFNKYYSLLLVSFQNLFYFDSQANDENTCFPWHHALKSHISTRIKINSVVFMRIAGFLQAI